MFSNDRNELRKSFFAAWEKHKNKQPMEPLEINIADIITMHPEYHKVFNDPKNIDNDYLPESGQTNPFLHLSLHIGLREQLATDRPTGITVIFNQLVKKHQDPHKVEHLMLECLAEQIWQSQQHGNQPDEIEYLEQLKALL